MDAKIAKQGGKPYAGSWSVRTVLPEARAHPKIRKRLAWGLVLFELAHNQVANRPFQNLQQQSS